MLDVTTIYVLEDPFDGAVRYVGKTLRPVNRKGQHLRGEGKSVVASWCAGIVARGAVPIFRPVAVIIGRQWMAAEREWIRIFRAFGADLLNVQPGGLVEHGSETRAKIAAASRARTISAEARERGAAKTRGRPKPPGFGEAVAARQKGVGFSPEATEKSRAARLGRKLSAEHRAKLSAMRKGVPKSPEHVARQAEAQRGRKLPPETIAKIRAGRTYTGHNEETRRKMSEAQRRRIEKHGPRSASPETRAKMSEAQRLRHAREKACHVVCDPLTS